MKACTRLGVIISFCAAPCEELHAGELVCMYVCMKVLSQKLLPALAREIEFVYLY